LKFVVREVLGAWSSPQWSEIGSDSSPDIFQKGRATPHDCLFR
jgi:hypothetical protein